MLTTTFGILVIAFLNYFLSTLIMITLNSILSDDRDKDKDIRYIYKKEPENSILSLQSTNTHVNFSSMSIKL